MILDPKTDSQIAGLAPVQSVAGRTGAVTLSTSDVSGLGTAALQPSLAFEAAGTALSLVSGHESDTTNVHGIADTESLYRSGGTDVAVADGGTGASNASDARTNLGLTLGTAAGNVVQLDGSGRLPAVDASQLTGLPSGSVAADAIWDAAGDLVYGTGANTASRLAIGGAGLVLAVNDAGTAPEWSQHDIWIRHSSNYSLPNDTNLNALFKQIVTNGALTIATGTYMLDGMIYVTGMSATSGNLKVDIVGAGTATIANSLLVCMGTDSSNPQNAQGHTATYTAGTASAASAVTAATAAAVAMRVKATFRVTTAGTIIPSVQLVTASAAVVQVGTGFSLRRLGPHNVDFQGAWA